MINKNAISKTNINKHAEIGLPRLVSLSSLKQFVVVPPLISQDSGVRIRICVHLIKSFLKPYLLVL